MSLESVALFAIILIPGIIVGILLGRCIRRYILFFCEDILSRLCIFPSEEGRKRRKTVMALLLLMASILSGIGADFLLAKLPAGVGRTIIVDIFLGIGIYFFFTPVFSVFRQCAVRRREREPVLLFCLCWGVFVGMWMTNWMWPCKWAVKEKNFTKYGEFILVEETGHTGTGWQIIGDENGYFEATELEDVVLTGEELPLASIPHIRNVFLCIVEPLGEEEKFIEVLGYAAESYQIREWYPVYPVVRDKVFPQFFYPQGYMTKKDIAGY